MSFNCRPSIFAPCRIRYAFTLSPESCLHPPSSRSRPVRTWVPTGRDLLKGSAQLDWSRGSDLQRTLVASPGPRHDSEGAATPMPSKKDSALQRKIADLGNG